MRYAVLIFGFFASLATAALGVLYFNQHDAKHWLHDEQFFDLDFFFNTTERHLPLTGLFLFIAAGYCLLGAFLAFFRCGWQGALLMIASLVGPAILSPMTLVATGPQLCAAFLACFVRPVPVEPKPVSN